MKNKLLAKESEFKELCLKMPSEDLIPSDVEFSENDLAMFEDSGLSEEGLDEEERKFHEQLRKLQAERLLEQ